MDSLCPPQPASYRTVFADELLPLPRRAARDTLTFDMSLGGSVRKMAPSHNVPTGCPLRDRVRLGQNAGSPACSATGVNY